jgi:xanthine dehydrogenase YagR molybdenum-binding subunit
MYYGTGYRPHTVQRVAFGASHEGRLAAIVHDAYQETSTYEEYTEALLDATLSAFVPECLHAASPRAHERAHPDLELRAALRVL